MGFLQVRLLAYPLDCLVLEAVAKARGTGIGEKEYFGLRICFQWHFSLCRRQPGLPLSAGFRVLRTGLAFAGGTALGGPSAWFSWGWGVATGLASVQEQPAHNSAGPILVLKLLRPRQGGHGGRGGMGVVGAQHTGGVTLRSSQVPTASLPSPFYK